MYKSNHFLSDNRDKARVNRRVFLSFFSQNLKNFNQYQVFQYFFHIKQHLYQCFTYNKSYNTGNLGVSWGKSKRNCLQTHPHNCEPWCWPSPRFFVLFVGCDLHQCTSCNNTSNVKEHLAVLTRKL